MSLHSLYGKSLVSSCLFFFFVIFCKPLSFNLCELLSPPPPLPPPEQNSKAGWKETESLTQRLLRQDPVYYVRIPSDWNNQEADTKTSKCDKLL